MKNIRGLVIFFSLIFLSVFSNLGFVSSENCDSTTTTTTYDTCTDTNVNCLGTDWRSWCTDIFKWTWTVGGHDTKTIVTATSWVVTDFGGYPDSSTTTTKTTTKTTSQTFTKTTTGSYPNTVTNTNTNTHTNTNTNTNTNLHTWYVTTWTKGFTNTFLTTITTYLATLWSSDTSCLGTDSSTFCTDSSTTTTSYQCNTYQNKNILHGIICPDGSCVPAGSPCPNTCTSFVYNNWSTCVNNLQTRTVNLSLPIGCNGGNPILNQTCNNNCNSTICPAPGCCINDVCDSDCLPSCEGANSCDVGCPDATMCGKCGNNPCGSCPPDSTCSEGCCNPDGSCTTQTFVNDVSCLKGASLTQSCTNSVHKALNSAKWNWTKRLSTCVWGTSCEFVSSGSDMEYCTYGCASTGADCLHRYCLDKDDDGYANQSVCVNAITHPGDGKNRTDYQYVLFETAKTWQAAQDDCVTKGGNLVQVVDSEVKQILDSKFPRSIDSSTEYWIGFNDQATEGKFVWPKGNIGEPSAYNWGSNQPDNSYNPLFLSYENCVVVQKDGIWNDLPCNSDKSYVCELPYTFDCDDSNPAVAQVCVHTGSASWSNLVSRDMQIDSADLNDTVLMVSNVAQSGLNYNVKTNNTNWAGKITTVDLEPKKLNQGSFSPWFINNRVNNLFFILTDATSSIWNSNTLTVRDKIGNAVPHVEIISPEDNANSSYGGDIQFNATVYDEDDFLKVTWDFGDGQGKTFDNYAQAVNGSSSLSINHTYSSCGLVDVKLTAEEKGSADGREQIREDSHKFFVYKEGICVFPVISSPEKRYDYPPLVLFNATQSFVTNCSSTVRSDEDFKVGSLSCTYVHKKGQGAITGNYHLFVEWIIDNTKKISGEWNSDVSGMQIQKFYRWFGVKAQHIAQLKLTFTN